MIKIIEQWLNLKHKSTKTLLKNMGRIFQKNICRIIFQKKFEWVENKYKSNQEKHGIDFNDAKEVFSDENRTLSEDKRFDYSEERWITIGKMFKVIIVVVYTIRDATRLISARYANTKERNSYNSKENKQLWKQIKYRLKML